MSDPATENQLARFVSDLRTIAVFADFPQEDLEWIAERMDEVRYEAGHVYGREGDPVDFLVVLLEGELQVERPNAPTVIVEHGTVTGLLPYSRLTQFRGTARAVLPSRALRLHKKYFADMLHRSPLLGQRLVGLMSDRIREITRLETQQEKLMALGKLSAGLAHELNNPAAAARRASQTLREAMESVRGASMKLLKYAVTDEQRETLLDFEQGLVKKIQSVDAQSLISRDPLEANNREEEILSFLEQHNVAEPWKIAPILAEAGVRRADLENLVAVAGSELMSNGLKRVSLIITIFGLIQEIDNSTRRISDLVTAIKRYSYMDQAPMQEVDLHEDLENTLKIFGHWLKSGITVKREYDANLPRVCAFGSELNQVWTNLFDNAIDAMEGKGELRIHTARELDHVLVEIGDNGPGIPKEIQSRIFEPFFTTKKVGDGTGLGLDTSMRIIRRHHGSIDVKSQPGDTRFRIRLPIQQPKAQAPVEEPKAS